MSSNACAGSSPAPSTFATNNLKRKTKITMKKMFLAIATLLLGVTFTACGPSAETTEATSKADSLSGVVAQKDSIINDAFASIDEIATSLSQISDRERLVITASANPEVSKTQKEQIAENISAISDLLLKNRDAIKKLGAQAAKLKAANVKIDALESLVASLQEQLANKNVQIEELVAQVRNLNIEVADLKVRTEDLETDKKELETTVTDQTNEKNTVYFVVGGEKSLMQKDIIDKKGFIGRTRTVKNTSDLTEFTKGDLRNLEHIAIGAKGARVVSSHPEGSYIIVKGAKNVDEELVITDKDNFWRNTKILIISHK